MRFTVYGYVAMIGMGVVVAFFSGELSFSCLKGLVKTTEYFGQYRQSSGAWT
jgi:hypothetical protein